HHWGVHLEATNSSAPFHDNLPDASVDLAPSFELVQVMYQNAETLKLITYEDFVNLIRKSNTDPSFFRFFSDDGIWERFGRHFEPMHRKTRNGREYHSFFFAPPVFIGLTISWSFEPKTMTIRALCSEHDYAISAGFTVWRSLAPFRRHLASPYFIF